MKPRLATVALLVPWLAAASAGAQVDAPTLEQARATLRGVLEPTTEAAQALRALRGTDDAALLPLFSAMCGSGDRAQRLFAVMATAEMGGQAADEQMRTVFRQERDFGIRGVALDHLIEHRAAEEQDLRLALDSGDESLLLLAARQAVKTPLRPEAIEALRPLLDRNNPDIVILARLVLLAADDFTQAPKLVETLTSGRTSPRITLVALNLVQTDAIRSAMPVIQRLLDGQPDASVRVGALRAWAAIAPAEGCQAIVEAIEQIDDTVARVQLMASLAASDEGRKHLGWLRESHAPLVAELAAFELACQAGSPELPAATARLLGTAHPIVVEFVLRRVREQPREAYVQPLAAYIRAVPAQSRRLTAVHETAASAAGVLVQLSSPAAVQALQELLAGPYDAVTRSVAAGLVTAEGKALPQLCLPLLESPYDELRTDAAFALGRLRDARALPALRSILENPSRYGPALTALASWHVLKIANADEAFVVELARQVR